MKYVFNEITHYRFPTHVNDLLIDRAEADTAEVFITVIEPGGSSPLHVHHDMEQIFHVIEGTGTLYIGHEEQAFPLKPGDVARIPVHTYHRAACTSTQPLRYLSVDCFINGRPTAEPTWDSHVKVVCQNFGWQFDEVKRAK